MFSRRKPWIERSGILEAELIADVALHARRRRGGEADHRRRAQQGQALAEHAVFGSEVVAPLGDAVRLVDGDQRRLALGQHLRETRDRQALGGDEQEVEAALEVVEAGLARVLAATAGMDALGAKALLLELCHLVFHEGDQGAHDESCAAARDPRQLVAERLAGAGRHHQQRVAALDDGAANRLLMGPEALEAESRVQQVMQSVGLGGASLGARLRTFEQATGARLAEGLLGAMHVVNGRVTLHARRRFGEQRGAGVGYGPGRLGRVGSAAGRGVGAGAAATTSVT